MGWGGLRRVRSGHQGAGLGTKLLPLTASSYLWKGKARAAEGLAGAYCAQR